MFSCSLGVFVWWKLNAATNIFWQNVGGQKCSIFWGRKTQHRWKPLFCAHKLCSPSVFCDISKKINTLFVCDIYKKFIIWYGCRFNSWKHTREGWTSDPNYPHDKCWLHPCLLLFASKKSLQALKGRYRANGRELMWGSGKGNYPHDPELERLWYCQACDLDGECLL